MDNIKPFANESIEKFTVRAHRELMDSIPNAYDRSCRVIELWRKANGPTEGEILRQKRFPSERFELKPDPVCYFVEHDTVDRNKRRVSFRPDDLVEIIGHANNRILDRENFPAISLGHTSDDPEATKPDVGGFAGPYFLGMVGNKNPKWAIYSMETHNRQYSKALSERPRRSVELIRLRSTGEKFFDPIAALGSEVPRIPMPTMYAASFDESAEVTRYSFSAYPGGSNTFVPSAMERKPERYGEDDMLSNEQLSQLIDAIQKTDQFQFLSKLMASPAAQQLISGAGSTGAGPEMGGAAPPPGAGADPMAGGGGGDDEYKPLDDGKFSLINEDALIERFQALEESDRAKNATIERLVRENVAQKRRAEDADRREKLRDLSERFSIDFDSECKRFLYSMAGEQVDNSFDQWADWLEKYGTPKHVRLESIPQGIGVNGDADIDRFSESLHSNAIRIFTESVERGEVMTYDQAVAKAKSEKK